MDLVGIDLAEEVGKKKEEERKKKKKKKKELSPESNLGPLILRDSGRYAYNSEGVAAATLKGPGEKLIRLKISYSKVVLSLVKVIFHGLLPP